jgi:hypothetical protein
MTEFVLVLLVIAVVVAALRYRGQLARGQEQRESLAAAQQLTDEDVTRFGEELQELHIDTLTDTLDTAMRQDYQRALDSYEHAKHLLAGVRKAEHLTGVTTALEDGRYAQACVRARIAGEALPQRRPPCFFDPAHGPGQTDILWSPPGGVPRQVPTCLADAERVRAGVEPAMRQVRRNNRMVPWYDGGPAFAPYARGYYQPYAMEGIFPAFLLGSIVGGGWGMDGGQGTFGGSGDGWSDGGSSDGGWGGGDFGGGGDGGGGF